MRRRKLLIPEEILTKPGKLTAEEFAIVKRHTVIGAETVSYTHLDVYKRQVHSNLHKHQPAFHHNESGWPEASG